MIFSKICLGSIKVLMARVRVCRGCRSQTETSRRKLSGGISKTKCKAFSARESGGLK
jgi:hypothetical protein